MMKKAPAAAASLGQQCVLAFLRNKSLIAVLVIGAMIVVHQPHQQPQLKETQQVTTKSVLARNALDLQQCLDLQLDTRVNYRVVPTPNETDKCLLYQEPSPFVKIVMTFVVGAPNQGQCVFATACKTQKPYNEELRKFGNDWPPFGYTMIGKQRLENFRAAIHEVDRNNIPGAIIELGVWRGGAMIMASAVTWEAQTNRQLYLYDAFEAIPGYGKAESFLANSEADVRSYFELFGLLKPNVHFVKGLFKDTAPHWKKGTPVAVLRVDGNYYDSYQDAMYGMYEDVPVGGIVIFDDIFTHVPVQAFWNDFKADHGVPETINRIDTHSGWFRKTMAVKIDQSKKHPPQDVNKPAPNATAAN